MPATHHLVSREQFAKMKATAFLINTARGPVVDEQALCEALAAKTIAGAGLDVFEVAKGREEGGEECVVFTPRLEFRCVCETTPRSFGLPPV